MSEFIFNLPLAVTGPAIIAVLCLFAVVGLAVVRRHVLPRLKISVGDSEFSGAMLQSIMVFYGLAVALIAVSVWQTYSDTAKIVSEEASSLNALYRDVSSYPDPIRTELQQELRDYTAQIIHEAWPLMQRGITPTAGFLHMGRFQAVLDQFEPATEGQKLLHGETLRAYNILIQARRHRLDAARTSLPVIMWVVIIIGAFIGLCASFFFKVEDPRLHRILGMLLAVFMGLVIFMIFALDRPFQGDLGLRPDAYQLIYDQLMTGSSPVAPKGSSDAVAVLPAGPERLAGGWVRLDGGYAPEIRGASGDGKLAARHLSPNPIHVARAEWRRADVALQVFVELRNVNAPGSSNTVAFLSTADRLAGKFFQAREQPNLDVEFVR